MPRPSIPAEDPGSPSPYEQRHVHAVYDAIAPHFASTRHRPWPGVAAFLRRQPAGAVGVDVGCGNGRYLGVNPLVHVVGCDRSRELVRLARRERGRPDLDDVLVADGLALPFAAGRADFALCVAVVHHLSTRPRRRDAVARVIECLRPAADARALLYVWALEQGASRRGWDAGGEQDLLVPWVNRAAGGGSRGGGGGAQAKEAEGEGETFMRYYHLYAAGELEEDVRAAGGVVLEHGYERDNWWVICTRELGRAETP